jgi:peptide deformylase
MLKIVKYPAVILKKKAKEVEKITPELLALIVKMEAAMQKSQGVGLAAPQVGVSKQIIVVKEDKKNHSFFNPRLRSKSKKHVTDEEGCLSLPGLFLRIKRAQSVKVLCNMREGKSIMIEATGLLARIFQHEIDHVQGRLIIDRITPLQRWKIRKKLDDIKKKGRVQEQ